MGLKPSPVPIPDLQAPVLQCTGLYWNLLDLQAPVTVRQAITAWTSFGLRGLILMAPTHINSSPAVPFAIL